MFLFVSMNLKRPASENLLIPIHILRIIGFYSLTKVFSCHCNLVVQVIGVIRVEWSGAELNIFIFLEFIYFLIDY